jgi:hypothetical protein
MIPMAGWATLARERADQLREEIDELTIVATPPQTITDLNWRLQQVRHDNIDAPHHFLSSLTGDAVNESWNRLHRIEEHVAELWKDENRIVAEAEKHLHSGLPRKVEAELQQKLDTAAQNGKRKKVALDVIREVHRAVEIRHESERNTQRGIVALAAALFAMGILAVALQATAFSSVRLVPLPADGSAVAAWALLAVIMLFGMLGGVVSALVSLYVTNRQFTDTLWYDPRPALTLVKVTLGMWTAVVGVLAVATGDLVGSYSSMAALLLLAFVFGYGQHAVTMFIDRRVGALLEEKKS